MIKYGFFLQFSHISKSSLLENKNLSSKDERFVLPPFFVYKCTPQILNARFTTFSNHSKKRFQGHFPVISSYRFPPAICSLGFQNAVLFLSLPLIFTIYNYIEIHTVLQAFLLQGLYRIQIRK